MVALAGLLFTGLAVFTSMALATIVVVLIAVIGSLTVLPATLALLGDRIDKGRIPFLGRRRATPRAGAWARLAQTVTRRPVVSLVTAVCLLGTLAIPALELKPASSFESALPADLPAIAAQRAIERAFPGAPNDAELVVTGRGLDGAQAELQALGERARAVTGGRGAIGVDVARDGRTAVVSVPMPDRGDRGGGGHGGRAARPRRPDRRAGRAGRRGDAHRRGRRQRGLHAPAGDRHAGGDRARARARVPAARRRVPLAGPRRGGDRR